MTDDHESRKFSPSEAPTPVEGHTKLSLKAAMRACRASAKEAEAAAASLLQKVSQRPPPLGR